MKPWHLKKNPAFPLNLLMILETRNSVNLLFQAESFADL